MRQAPLWFAPLLALWGALCAVAPLLASSPAGAELVDQGPTTLDTVTGLEWLDLSVPQVNPDVPPTEEGALSTYSYDEIVAGAGGFAAEGWRYATRDEICDLIGRYMFLAAGCPPTTPGDPPGYPYDGYLATFRLLDDTYNNNLVIFSGLFDDGDPSNGVGFADFEFEDIDPVSLETRIVQVNSPYASDVPANFYLEQPVTTVSHFLVRPMPESGSETGMCAVLAGLVAVSRRSRAKRVAGG